MITRQVKAGIPDGPCNDHGPGILCRVRGPLGDVAAVEDKGGFCDLAADIRRIIDARQRVHRVHRRSQVFGAAVGFDMLVGPAEKGQFHLVGLEAGPEQPAQQAESRKKHRSYRTNTRSCHFESPQSR